MTTETSENVAAAPPEWDDETAAAIAAGQGFVVEETEHVEWFIDKRYGYELEIKMIEQRAAMEIETIQRRAEEAKKPFQREVDSLNFRFLHQVERVCRDLIAGLKKGKTVTFARGAASTKKTGPSIEIADASSALQFAQELGLSEAIRQKPPVTPPPELDKAAMKKWMLKCVEAEMTVALTETQGDAEAAQKLFDERFKTNYPFAELRPETQTFTLEIG